jgi:hypothetical protein
MEAADASRDIEAGVHRSSSGIEMRDLSTLHTSENDMVRGRVLGVVLAKNSLTIVLA